MQVAQCGRKMRTDCWCPDQPNRPGTPLISGGCTLCHSWSSSRKTCLRDHEARRNVIILKSCCEDDETPPHQQTYFIRCLRVIRVALSTEQARTIQLSVVVLFTAWIHFSQDHPRNPVSSGGYRSCSNLLIWTRMKKGWSKYYRVFSVNLRCPLEYRSPAPRAPHSPTRILMETVIRRKFVSMPCREYCSG